MFPLPQANLDRPSPNRTTKCSHFRVKRGTSCRAGGRDAASAVPPWPATRTDQIRSSRRRAPRHDGRQLPLRRSACGRRSTRGCRDRRRHRRQDLGARHRDDGTLLHHADPRRTGRSLRHPHHTGTGSPHHPLGRGRSRSTGQAVGPVPLVVPCRGRTGCATVRSGTAPTSSRPRRHAPCSQGGEAWHHVRSRRPNLIGRDHGRSLREGTTGTCGGFVAPERIFPIAEGLVQRRRCGPRRPPHRLPARHTPAPGRDVR